MIGKKLNHKKIGLLNFHFSNCNYGAVLQAAALHEFLSSTGNDVETIDFIPRAKTKSNAIKDFLKWIKHTISPNVNKIYDESVFENFRKKWLPRSSRRYNTIEELQSSCLKYDSVVVGSDQVWRPKYTLENFEAYFLSFVEKPVKKIAYAPSFGVDNWEYPHNDHITIKTSKLLEQFDAISVREESGQDICRDMFGLAAEVVLDPTLLVGRSFFDKIIGNPSNSSSKTIVYYKLDVDEDFNNALSKISTQLNLPAENIYADANRAGNKMHYNEVTKWLKKIKESELVITDSFHCTCFAILFEKPFLYYPNTGRGLTRIESLFSLLSIDTNCIITDSQKIEDYTKFIWNSYTEVNSRLDILREKSKEFLLGSL